MNEIRFHILSILKSPSSRTSICSKSIGFDSALVIDEIMAMSAEGLVFTNEPHRESTSGLRKIDSVCITGLSAIGLSMARSLPENFSEKQMIQDSKVLDGATEVSDEMLRFPDNLIAKVRRSRFYTIENEDIASKEDFDQLIKLMFDYPEIDFYLFSQKATGLNNLIIGGEKFGVLRIEYIEMQYYQHPNYRRDWIKIDKYQSFFEWEKDVLETSPEYFRCTLKLTDRWRRKIDLQEILAQSKGSGKGGIFQWTPNFYGIGINIPNALKYLKSKFFKKT